MFYDYTEKDHLGNTRVVLTDQEQQDVYPAATLEQNASSFATEEAYYTINPADTINVSEIPSWSSTTGNNYANNNGNPPYNNDPNSNTGATSTEVYKLNGSTGDKTGLGITLKVMKGDVVNIYGKSFWHSTGTNPSNTYLITSALNTFIGAFAATGAIASNVHNGTTALENTSSPTPSGITGWLNSVPNPGSASVPRAYINWILFNDQFVPISSGSGFDLVNTTADAVKNHNISVTINNGGYLYVYCSNESNINVFFDNLQVIDTRGPLLETDNYYPFGLTQAGISSNAAGKLEDLHKFNKGSELQHKEFSDGTGLEEYDTHYRQLDPQLGRWNEVDPDVENDQESLSPYQSMGDDPIRYNDELGNEPCCAELGLRLENALADFLTTQKKVGVTEVAGLGPEDPVADVVSIGLELKGLYDMGSDLFGSAPAPAAVPATPAPAAPTAVPTTPAPAAPAPVVATPAVHNVGAPSRAELLKASANAQSIPKPPKGKGSVAPDQRDPKRTYTKKERAEMLDKQQGKCAQCGEEKNVDEVDAHHIVRHADGGKTVPDNGAAVCTDCHVEIHH